MIRITPSFEGLPGKDWVHVELTVDCVFFVKRK